MDPQVGDIWLFHGAALDTKIHTRHYLILKKDSYNQYRFLRMEEGIHDAASILHFQRYCRKVA